MSKPGLTNLSADEQRDVGLASKRDEVLRRLLHTPPQPLLHTAPRKSRAQAAGTKAAATKGAIGERPRENGDGE
jgi:hypothetical protein